MSRGKILRGIAIGALVATAACSGAPDGGFPAPSSLVGAWRLVDEAAADGGVLSMPQEIREYTFAADRTYSLRSYHDNRDGAWALAGDTLTLTSGSGPVTVPVLALTSRELVLVEAVPPILRRRPSSAARSRNTFRRVDEAELGPLLGSSVETAAPTAGRYAARYGFGSAQYPTTEIYIQHDIRGAAIVDLAADGTATACLAVHAHRSTSISHYASPDREDHRSEDDQRLLLGARGTWVVDGDAARVVLDHTTRAGCAVPGNGDPGAPPVVLTCRAVAPTDRIPLAAVACRLDAAPHGADAIAINPADSPRAGPYTLQSGPAQHFDYGLGTPWLLLGPAPGLEVTSHDGRGRGGPQVTFASAAAAVEIDELAYRDAR